MYLLSVTFLFSWREAEELKHTQLNLVVWLLGVFFPPPPFSFFSQSKIQTGKQHHFPLKPGCFGKQLNWFLNHISRT